MPTVYNGNEIKTLQETLFNSFIEQKKQNRKKCKMIIKRRYTIYTY